MALPDGHQYRAVADHSYRPKRAVKNQQWELAFPLFVDILAADPRRLTDHYRLLETRRAALARHLYWLAGDDPEQLNADLALDDIQVMRSGAWSAAHTTERSRAALMSQIRSFRGGYPKLFSEKPKPPKPAQLEPVTDRDFAIALQAAETFRNPATQDRVKAFLVLCRSAGADAADCRYIAGTDVFRRSGAGLWVCLRRPGYEREVPVLERFAYPLGQFAKKAGAGLLVSSGPSPAPIGACAELTSMLLRRMKGQYPGLRISAERIRKAWVLEQLQTWTKLHAFLDASGLKSMHSVDDIRVHCVRQPMDPATIAEILGGMPSQEPLSWQGRRGNR